MADGGREGRGGHWVTPGLSKQWSRGGIPVWALSALLLASSGCAGLSCRQLPITVAKKDERGRLELAPRGYTTETGRLEELRRPEIVRDYWVQDAAGAWHRVSLEQYQVAQVGEILDLCR